MPVEPEPLNGSSTVPPGGHIKRHRYAINAIGFTVLGGVEIFIFHPIAAPNSFKVFQQVQWNLLFIYGKIIHKNYWFNSVLFMPHNAYKIRTIRCISCKKEVTERMPKNRQYCSLVCYRHNSRPTRYTGEKKACTFCAKDVYIPRCRVKPVNFCSLDCHNNWQKRNKHNFTCKICGQPFQWSPSRITHTNPTYCSPKCRDKDPERREMLLRMNVNQQIAKTNNLEVKGYKLLNDLGFVYEPQKMLFDKFCVDAVCEKQKIILQFDGDYWHGNPARFFVFTERQKKRSTLDRSQDAYLQKCGYQIIRLWESDIKHNYLEISLLLRSFLIQKEQILSLDPSNHLVISSA